MALAKKFVAFNPQHVDLQTAVRRFRTAIEIFREANVPLVSEAEGLAAQYQQITGSMTAEWGGERVPLPRLSPFLKSHDRAVRESAWRASTLPYVDSHDEMSTLFSRMVVLRQSMARNAGFANYRDYVLERCKSAASTTRPPIVNGCTTRSSRRSFPRYCVPSSIGARASASTSCARGTWRSMRGAPHHRCRIATWMSCRKRRRGSFRR